MKFLKMGMRLADGALKLMTKKDGTLMANLVNPETNKIVSTVSLQSTDLLTEGDDHGTDTEIMQEQEMPETTA